MTAFKKLTEIVDTLMSENGCPWDKVQTRESLKPFLIEEVYETLEALDGNKPDEIKDELGDLLYQILFHAKISENRNEFNIEDVVQGISEKMIRRHPHVFEDGNLDTPEQVVTQWDEIKKQEKNLAHRESVLDGIPKHLPGLLRAQKLQRKPPNTGLTGMPSPPSSTNSMKRSPSSRKQYFQAKRPTSKASWETSCSCWSISPNSKRLMQKKPCAEPIINSSNASNISKRKSPNAARN